MSLICSIFGHKRKPHYFKHKKPVMVYKWNDAEYQTHLCFISQWSFVPGPKCKRCGEWI